MTVTDAGGLSTTADVGVTVDPVLGTITVVPAAPAPASLADDGRQAFAATAYDQFGHPLSPQPAFRWSVPAGEGSSGLLGRLLAPRAPRSRAR